MGQISQPEHTPPAPSIVSEVLAGGGEMGALMRRIDWAKTPAGPVESWPQSLRTVLGILLSSEHPIFVWWGKDLVQFYNDGYRPILGSTKHPMAMGQRGRECWKEIWDVIAPMIDQVFAGGATYIEDGLLVLDRHGFLEECYFNYAYSPIRGEARDVAGVFVACSESTGRVIGERRLMTLSALAATASEARSQDEACRATAEVLSTASSDIPFALVYLVKEGATEASLVEVIGLAPSHRLAVPTIALADDAGGVWPLASALRSEVEVAFEPAASEGLPGGPWPEPSRRAVVLPLVASVGEGPNGFLVAGASPRLGFDDAYRGFLRLVAGHVASAIRGGRAYEEEKRRAEAFAELDRAKTAFFSNVSHEFRTPLTLMLGPIEEGLADGENPLAPVQRERQEMVQRNVLRLHKLVNALLDFSRIGAGEVRARREPLDLAALTSALASTFESMITSAGLRLVIDCPTLPGPVWIDPGMWETIVLNLLSNAFKFTLSGEIRVKLRSSGERVVLSVSDTGAGIGTEDQERIFDRFHRVEGAIGRSDEGSGIGLSLVRELVKLHSGDVVVQSVEGAGSEFRVSVPSGPVPVSLGPPTSEPRRASLAQHAHAFVQEAQQWLSPQLHERSLSRTESRGHVLLADDNADMRAYLSRLLESRFTVESVGDGHAALAAARARIPDLVLSDVMMPGLDGYDLLRALNEDPRTASVPVILISARAGEEATIEGLSAGVVDYIVKPFSARELLARVEAGVKAARAQAETARLLEEIEAARGRLHGLFENAPAFVCALRGPEHVYEMYNTWYARLVGVGRPLTGLRVQDALPEVVAQGFIDLLDRVYRTGEPYFGSEIPLVLDRNADGRMVEAFLNFTYQPRRDAQGEITGIDVFGFDVSEQVEARREAELLAAQLRLAAQRKDEFLAMLAHELRNPMAALSLALTLLETVQGDPSKATRHREIARRQVRHLVRLVDDLLDVSRITRGTVDLRKEATDLASVLHHAMTVAHPSIEERRLELSLAVAPGPFGILADPTRLEQVIVNLLTNAAKYTDPGGHITVALERETLNGQCHALLSVRDTGRGIPAEMLKTVFDLFVQVTPTRDRTSGGLGLGLTVVKGLVEMHGGSVTARSDGPGTGSEFVVRLPLTSLAGASGGPAENPPGSTQQAPTARGLRIVLVEDSEDVRELMRECLGDLGHEVEVADNGIDGVAKALDGRPDVILVDVGLPQIDGYEVARQLRAAPGGDAFFMIALTGYGGAEAQREAERGGFDLHITKPVDVERLQSILMGGRPDEPRAGRRRG